jgi:hypothetical protein
MEGVFLLDIKLHISFNSCSVIQGKGQTRLK